MVSRAPRCFKKWGCTYRNTCAFARARTSSRWSAAGFPARRRQTARDPRGRLVFTWAWIGTPERVSQVSLSFVQKGKGTEFTLLHEYFFDMAARDGHEFGWTGSMEKLARFLQQ